jgi:hypothetical protein
VLKITFQERVVSEKKELDLKRKGLSEFLDGEVFSGLPVKEQGLLLRQFTVMTAYSQILRDRIACFKK